LQLASSTFSRTAAAVLVLTAAAEGAFAGAGVPGKLVETVTYEVAPTEIVTREISNYETVVKEIDPQEVIRKKRAQKEAQRPKPKLDEVSTEIPDLASFLDRLMMSESGGRDTAANPLSTALGPFQFIKSTFLDVARRHFPPDYADLSDEQVLALRTTRHFARAAAAAYTMENAAFLRAAGHEPSWPHLRLAFLLGPAGAERVLQAAPETPLSQILGGSVLQANPFMKRLTATGLIARAARDVGIEIPTNTATGEPAAVPRPEAQARPSARARPGTATPGKGESSEVANFKIKCNQRLISCQRWIALQKRKQDKVRNAEGNSGKPPRKG
jgi:hypothetical protein